MSKPLFPIQTAELTYNGYTITLRPLALSDLPLLVEKYEPQIRRAIKIIQDAARSKDPATIELAQLQGLIEIAPLIPHAVAISAGLPNEVVAFANLPMVVAAQAFVTVGLLTAGRENA